MFIETLFKILLFKGGVLIYAEHCRNADVLTETDIRSDSLCELVQIVCSSLKNTPISDQRAPKLPVGQSDMHSLLLCNSDPIYFCFWWEM